MKRLAIVPLLLALAGACLAAPPEVPRELRGQPGQLIRVVVKSTQEVGFLRSFSDEEAFFDELQPKPGERRFVFQSNTPGRYTLGFWTKNETEGTSCTVVISGTPPGPGPTPDPKPPTPDPKPPSPAPIPLDGLRVLIVYESGQATTMPEAQRTILYGKTTRDYLNAKCPLGADGKTREYRIWDQDTDAASDAPHWGVALKRPRASLPWVIVSNGKSGFEGPLPSSAPEFLELLKKYEVTSGR